MSDICETSGKVKHPDPQRAHSISRRMTKRNNEKINGKMYKCPDCKSWHITSKPQSLRIKKW